MEYRHILFDVSDEIATITLNRPEARNALSMPMREDMDHALAHVKENAGGDIKAMIVTGAGGAFCAGGDVKAMNNRTARAPEGHKDMQKSHDRVYNLLNMPLPVISLIDGPAAGAGANLALAADFVLMTPKSFIMQAFARIGLVPDWGGFYILPRLVGLQKAKELVYTGRRVYAEEAKEMGLAYDVVEKETAMDEARSFARKLCQGPTAAIGVSKNILNQSYNQDYRTMLELEAMAQTNCRDTDFHKEAVRRFAAKETPLYDWESMKD
jgi:2-(1,2-epoxy-1,2-dihydrophenyl)acetyl-CoA isomerase